MCISNAKLDCASTFFHPAAIPFTNTFPSDYSYFKEINDLSLCDSLDRCEADVNPCQIKSYCGACIVCSQLEKAEKEACHAVLHAGVSVAGCKL